MKIKNHQWYMKIALEQAELGYRDGEVPVGCVIVDADDNIVSKTTNHKEKYFDATAHAEILAIKEASQTGGNWRLEGHTVYITLEPCMMCFSALLQARVKTVVFGAYDAKGGAMSLGYTFNKDSRLNHKLEIIGGIEHFNCSKILSTFFRERRKAHKL